MPLPRFQGHAFQTRFGQPRQQRPAARAQSDDERVHVFVVAKSLHRRAGLARRREVVPFGLPKFERNHVERKIALGVRLARLALVQLDLRPARFIGESGVIGGGLRGRLAHPNFGDFGH